MEQLTTHNRQDIADLLAKYCLALDGRDWAALTQVFTEDAIAEYEGAGTARGLAAITDVVRRALEPLDASQHFIATSLVETGDDGATGRTYLIARHIAHGAPGGDSFTVGGMYTDRFVRTPAGWRITHRRLSRVWTEGNPAVLSTPRSTR
ncbi:nuclear transport factor 2 family protein [Streptomyces sp. NBC_00841]|jgi:ketosteroid isomerase-like protein|uniref:nuclear transport factor 2 family protein n=1 Tax=Streptomyces sp. NBC_00841 TaxID=2975847 RepID=UPI002DDA4E3B|nr:nuclear transport factor 2 family protein [Streptomyces sp. NBC_00841]WRZ97009.1 nuclear transport factor 2 family protein [Streptomyces sp. NBC_00841]